MAIFNSYVSLPEGNCFITNDGGWHPHSWLHPYVWHVSCHHMARRPRRVFLCHHQARVFRRVAQDGPGGEAHGCGPHSDRCSAQPAGLFVKLCPVFGEWDVDLTPRGYIWDIHIFWLWLMGATKLRPSMWIHYIYIYAYIYIYIYYIYVLYYIYNAYGDKALNICRKKLCTSRTGESQGPVFMVVDTVSHKNWKSYLYHIIIT